MTAIIIHGSCDAEQYFEMDYPSQSNAHWLPWLQQKFLRAGYLCQTPEMPWAPQFSYAAWESVFSMFNPSELKIAVGHSAGAGFLLKYLSAHPDIRLDQLVLVAPYVDPKRKHSDFLAGQYDPSVIERVGQMHIFHSEDDDDDIQETFQRVSSLYPKAMCHIYHDKGHFCEDDLQSRTFPELWDIIAKELKP
jgi:predicted alpha/beta hydrolase family esterase